MTLYAPVRHHGFVNFDDSQYVSENPSVSAGLTWQGLSWAFTTRHAGNWHPLTWLSHMLDVQLFGLDAGAHHLTSLALHVANTLLLFGLLHAMTGALVRSAFVAALFGVHPLHVESVAWVAERKDVLSALFFFSTLWAYLAYVRKPRPGRYALVLVLFALGLMAKPMLVTLPFVLLLLDYWPLARTREPSARRRLVLEKLPLLGLAAASSFVTFVVQRQAGAVKALDALPLDRRLVNAVISYVAYIGQTLWPARLAAIYPYPASFPAWAVTAAVVVLVAVTVLAVRMARRYPYLPVGWLWYLGTLVPVIGLVQVGSQPMADRYTYIPLVGLFVVVAWGLPDLLDRWPHWKRALGAAAALALLGCTIVARRQVEQWRNSVELWEHALAVTRENYRAQNNLGHALAKQGRTGEAIPHYAEAVRIKPDFAEAHNDLGAALADQGRMGEAIDHYSEAVRLLPDYVEARNNLAVALTAEGRYDEAVRHFSEALRLDPTLAASHNNLGVALAKQGRLEEAIRHFSEALRLAPDYAEARRNLAVAHNGLGAALADQDRLEEAIAQYSESARLDPDRVDAHSNLAAALAARGRPDEAIRELLAALRLAPGDADLHYDLGVMLARIGRRAEAIGQFEAALSADPAHEPARRALAALGRQRM
ncbi:MAG TPA: tetratricopeptide repeat protein [Vicinamibacteria bacterium]